MYRVGFRQFEDYVPLVRHRLRRGLGVTVLSLSSLSLPLSLSLSLSLSYEVDLPGYLNTLGDGDGAIARGQRPRVPRLRLCLRTEIDGREVGRNPTRGRRGAGDRGDEREKNDGP